MRRPNVMRLLKTIQKSLCRRSPEIFTGIGIAGMLTTAVLAVKATPKAMDKIDEASLHKKEKERDGKAELTKTEVIKVTWKCYIPAFTTAVFSVGCLIGAQSVNSRRITGLATAYKLSETALTEFKEAAVEVVGEEKFKEVKQKAAEKKVERTPVNNSTVIVTGGGNTLCLDGVYGQYFESSMENIRAAINNLNYRMLSEQYVSLNDFYDELGVDRIPVGDSVGWNISKHGPLEVEFGSQISKDGRPCLVLEYIVAPQYDYYKMY